MRNGPEGWPTYLGEGLAGGSSHSLHAAGQDIRAPAELTPASQPYMRAWVTHVSWCPFPALGREC